MQQLLAIILAVLVTAVVAENSEENDVVVLAEDFVSWLKNISDIPILDKKVRNIVTLTLLTSYCFTYFQRGILTL